MNVLKLQRYESHHPGYPDPSPRATTMELS